MATDQPNNLSPLPFISICIPAYQRPQYLKRLLDSISIQNFRDYEVVITDDSPDDTIKKLCSDFAYLPKLRYHKNERALGTPANWNAAIALAKGKWIKLMHDDDWFFDADSLQQFAEYAQKNEGSFIFSAFVNHFETTDKESLSFANSIRLKALKKHPASIVSKNIIGHPSTTLYPNDGKGFYDENLKWLVDLEMYIRRLQIIPFVYIPKTLVKLGMSSSQVTAQVKMVPTVEIPEHLYFINKIGVKQLKHIFTYDYFWRFVRNFNIKNVTFFKPYEKGNQTPLAIQRMVKFQSKVPHALLKFGPISKFLMLLHYLANKRKIIKRNKT